MPGWPAVPDGERGPCGHSVSPRRFLHKEPLWMAANGSAEWHYKPLVGYQSLRSFPVSSLSNARASSTFVLSLSAAGKGT